MNSRTLVITFLGLIAIVDVSLIGALALNGSPIPDVMPAVILADVTGMLGVLVPSPPT
jgi:hypothetical protein